MSINAFLQLMPDMLKAFYETLYMVGISLGIAIVLGIPIGILLFVSDKGLFSENRAVNWALGFVANMIRSIPFLILLVLLLPLTQAILGTTIGPTAAAGELATWPFVSAITAMTIKYCLQQ